MKLRRILLGDDDDDDCILFRSALADLNIHAEIDVACDGNAVIQYLYSQPAPPDVVYLDVNLPILNGFDCLNIIRNDRRLDRLPVILVTTPHIVRFGAAATKHIGLFHLCKPNRYCQLISEIERSIKLVSLHAIRYI
jgi:CheY-like chemotaxis protein